MGYDFAMIRAGQRRRDGGRDNKNDIRVKRRNGNRKKPPFYLLPRT